MQHGRFRMFRNVLLHTCNVLQKTRIHFFIIFSAYHKGTGISRHTAIDSMWLIWVWSHELKFLHDESDFWVTLLPWNLKIQIVPLVFYGYYTMERAKTINPVDCLQKVNMSCSIMLASALFPLVGLSHFAPIQQSQRCQCWWQTAITTKTVLSKNHHSS